MCWLYHIYNLNKKFVGFAYDEETAKFLAIGHGGTYELFYSEEFKWG